jgi:glyoxylase-like metal-dependent hydrolase (beta-lactamase superfamily II)
MKARCSTGIILHSAIVLFAISILSMITHGCRGNTVATLQEIVPGIYQIKASRSNVFLLAGKTLTLIDTGMPGDGEAILHCITSIGRKPEEVSHILITHAHMDHTGSLAFLKKATNAKVVASEAEHEYIQGNKKLWTMEREGFGGKIFKAVLFLAQTFFLNYQPAAVDILCRGEETMDYFARIKVIPTPGHSPGSLSYYIPDKGIIFTGDALSGEPDLRLPPRAGCANYKQAVESVKKLASLKYDICTFGHGEPIKGGADELIKKLIANIP